MPRLKLQDVIAANVRRIRRAKGFAQTDIADALGIEQTNVSRIERGGRDMKVSTLEALAIALDVDVGALCAGWKKDP